MLLKSPAMLGDQLQGSLVYLRPLSLRPVQSEPSRSELADSGNAQHVVAKIGEGVLQPCLQNRQGRLFVLGDDEQAKALREFAVLVQRHDRLIRRPGIEARDAVGGIRTLQ